MNAALGGRGWVMISRSKPFEVSQTDGFYFHVIPITNIYYCALQYHILLLSPLTYTFDPIIEHLDIFTEFSRLGERFILSWRKIMTR